MTRETTKAETFTALLVMALFYVAACIHWDAALDGDKTPAMHIAQQLLAGKHLYRDIFEINLPAWFYLYTLPIKFANVFGCEDGHALILLTLALFYGCVWLMQKLLKRHPAVTQQLLNGHIFLLSIVFVIWVNTNYFAGREHLFMLCIFPYLLRFMPSLRQQEISKNLSTVIGVLAAVGFAQKPYCLALFVTVQLIIYAQEKSRAFFLTLENKIILCLTAAYYAAILLFMPEYWQQVVPIMLATFSEYAVFAPLFYLVSAFYCFVTFLHFRTHYTSPYRKDILYFTQLLGGCFVYILLNNGWGYTFYPFDALVLYLTGWVGVEFLYLEKEQGRLGQPVKQFVEGARSCGANVVLHVGSVFAMYFLFWSQPEDQQLEAQMRNDLSAVVVASHSDSFGAMSSVMGFSSIARTTGAERVTRFDVLLMLPKFLTADAEFRKENEWILRFIAEAYAQDMDKNKPDLMFIDTSPAFFRTAKSADLIAMFSRYDAFAKAWKNYSFYKSINHCDDEKVKKIMYPSGCHYDAYQRKAALLTPAPQ